MMLFTVTLNRATSFASVRANPVTAARRLFDRTRPSIGCFTAIDVTFRILPQRRTFIPGRRARASPTALVSKSRVAESHISGVKLSNGPLGGPPEFVTRMSTLSNLSRAVFTTRSMPDCSETSATTSTTVTPEVLRIDSAVLRSDSSPRAQTTRFAPSAASSSAMARPSPLLLADTSATLPRRPRSKSAPQVIIFLVQPILPRWTEDIDIESLFERFGLVRNVRGDVQYFSSLDGDLLGSVFANPEFERALEDVRQLLILVRVLRHYAALFQIHLREHHPLAGD